MRQPYSTSAADEVRCLACGTIYAKPPWRAGADTDCPRCGHRAWLAISIPLDPRPLGQIQVGRPRFH
jgi:DNA-directed RNA polymerase subunit RPC12/RpoP